MRKRQILCIDLKSFYASVECALRGLNPDTTPLVVADKERGDGSIVLAVSPYLRSLGFPSRCRIFELNKTIDLIYAKPRMNSYIDYAIKVIDIYLDFVSDEDLFVYSIDEAFLDVTSYLKYYKMTSYELALTILNKIEEELKIKASCGIGENMLMSKFALDIEAKDNKDGIAIWGLEDLKQKLWPLSNLSKMWGIGNRMHENLNRLGIETIYDLAHFDVKRLHKHFGVMGIELYNHANGRDNSLIQDQDILKSVNHSYSVGQVLFKDYTKDGAKLIIREMTEDLTRRLRLNKKMCKTVKLSIGYSKEFSGGFSRQVKLDYKTNRTSKIYEAFSYLLEKFYDNKPIRKISVTVTNLTTQGSEQLSLFEDFQSDYMERMLDSSIDEIQNKYGLNSVFRATALTEESTKLSRSQKVGGHNA